ncbi:S26 family signal peptidase [Rossellomorea vietnamensis]|uniref:S26 family signal peptidase n=1 Tax=Rossellomorea vietnamensis TaxID=218284 RepID=A0A5D4KJB4_9BACI|nr:S26 family signal peptidase [Rossellomorea vietnamensis]
MDEQNATYDEESFREYFSRDIEEVELADNEVFVLGDNGWRSLDSSVFGPLSIENIEGKVLGMKQ